MVNVQGTNKMEHRIQQRLEEYLEGRLTLGQDPEFDRLLRDHPQDLQTLELFQAQSCLFREALRVPELAPAPGFYARVMSRIEEQSAQPTFWSVFAGSFGRRLVYVSAALLLVIGAAAIGAGDDDFTDVASAPAVETPAGMLVDDHPDVHLVGETVEDRGRVFVTLTAVEQ